MCVCVCVCVCVLSYSTHRFHQEYYAKARLPKATRLVSATQAGKVPHSHRNNKGFIHIGTAGHTGKCVSVDVGGPVVGWGGGGAKC